MRGGRVDVRHRMLQSLVESQHSLRGHEITLFLLLQNCTPGELAAFAASAPAFVRASAVAGQVPLSAARNLLLRPLLAGDGIDSDAVVAFPDDDCWYPEGFLDQAASLFARDAMLDFWFCRYASRPVRKAFAAAKPTRASTGEIVRNSSSNTIFLRGRVVNSIGQFDEALGVGTPLGGSEDLDYALRAQRVARETAYCDAALVGHRDKSRSVRARYYASSLLVLARHAREGVRGEYWRKIAVGMFLTLQLELKPRDFARALRSAIVEGRSR